MPSVLAERSEAARVAAAQARGQHVARSAEPGSSEVDHHAVASAFAVISETRGGERLPDELARRLTRELSVDLSQVRIHCDERAARIAAQVGARALTVRSDIYFAAGAYDPTTAAGIELIAHEVMHVAQNTRGAITLGDRAVSRPDDPHERQAVSFASQFITARPPARPSTAVEFVPTATVRGDAHAHGGRIDRAPARGGPDEMWHQMFHGESVAVGKLAHVSAPKGITLKAQPAPYARPVSPIIEFDKEVFVVRTSTESDVARRWVFVMATGSGSSGFIQEQFLALDPPEPRASLYLVKSGERLGKIVDDRFSAEIAGGNDDRLYVQATYELNKGRPGIWLEEVHLSRWDTMPREAAEEETLKVYRGVQIKGGNHPIWLPSKEFVQELKASGKITSGSTDVMKVARAAKGVALVALYGTEFVAGVVAGILEGAWQALVDVFKGAWELVKMAFEVMKAYLTGTLLGLMLETAEKVKSFFEKLDVEQLVKALGGHIVEKWTNVGWFGKGEFVGQIVGYIALNVLLVVATAGGSVGVLLAKAAESGSEVARAVMALVKVVDVAQNPLKLLEGAGKGLTVSEEIAAKLKRGLARDGAVARDVEHGLQDAKNAAEHGIGKPRPEPKSHAPGKDQLHEPNAHATSKGRPPGVLAELDKVLPRELKGRLLENKAIPGRGVRVSYKQGVRIEIGPKATAREIEWHIKTAKLLLRYEGPLGEIRKLLNAIGAKLRLVEKYGTEGFEAKAEIEKLNAIKSKLEAAQHKLEATFARYGEAKDVAVAEAEKLQQELAGIEAQIKEHEATLGSIEPGRGHVAAEDLAQKGLSNYRETFFTAHPELRGKVVVHHAIEQQVLQRYPGLFTEAEMHALENLRGIPNAANPDLHLSQIRKAWNEFYRTNASPTKQQVIDFVKKLDRQHGAAFMPPR
jgi:hypothetical protein